MNYTAMMLGAFGLVTIVTIYYTLVRKPATSSEPEPVADRSK
jgi:hypothetical protein